VGSADGFPRPRRPRRVRGWLAVLTAVLVAGAVAVASLDLAGELPGGLVTGDATTPAPTATTPLDPSPVAAPDVLAPEPGPSAPAAATVPVAALQDVLTSGALGPDPGALVLDAGTGAPLLERTAQDPRTPASVAKLATGAGTLLTLDPQSRLRTTVVQGGSPGELVLVGAGDATLTSAPARRGSYPPRASLAALAGATAAALKAAGTSRVTVRVDDSLFEGPARSPDWPSTYVGSGVVSPVSALSVDAGRVRPGEDAREPDPALAAGQELARLLARRGVTVDGKVARAAAAAGASELGAVESPTVAELVELMLTTSDNDLAESLLRLVAVESGLPGTFDDGTAAVTAVLDGLGVPTEGMVLLDGSGLARGSSMAPETLGRLLVTAGDGSRPVLDHLLTGLPVAGFSGTLALRYGAGRAGTAAGLVRAKTGTLTGVSTLAGAASVDGRPVVFVVMSDGVPGDTIAARNALDRFAATLIGAQETPRDAGG
jgi:D-alanyl-D-alanine carboxypeptidase/D-alanyl-D-alanine-endopeptidase (penicillin-binding protein 4)